MEINITTSPRGQAIVQPPEGMTSTQLCSITFEDFGGANFQSLRMWFDNSPASIEALESLMNAASRLRHALKGDPMAVTVNITGPVL